MNIWIITTGSSDVQLKTENNWNPLRGKVRSQLETQKQFNSSKSSDGKRFLYPARAVGVVYGTAIENDLKYYEDLDFPLLNNFFWILEGKDDEAGKIIIDRVIVLVTDQCKKFKASEKNNPFSAFWQDTCTLKPILREYFKRRFIENPEFLILDPDPIKSSGLDNWNDVLERVQEKFKEKFADFQDVLDDTTIYVSHQAGTPAISSAVQFCSLAQFGDRVKFLVSNEYNPAFPEKPLEGSSYLRGIRIQEAKALLGEGSYNYAGVETLIGDYIQENEDIKILLNAAKNWNVAKFDDFLKELKHYPKFASEVAERREENWWWTAYEAAYLAWLRLDQGNTVDAFFHSFRSIEGAFSNWGKKVFHEYIELENDRAFLQPSILESPHDYFKSAKFNQDGTPINSLARLKKKLLNLMENLEKANKKDQKSKGILFADEDLYILFRSQKPDYKSLENFDFNRFWNSENGIKEKRNKNFHQLQGLSQDELLENWEVSSLYDWERQIIAFLNFIAKEDLPKEFTSLKEASLMVKVHQELVDAIADL